MNGNKYVILNMVNKKNEIVNTGIISEGTEILFRSASAKQTILVYFF